MKYRKKAVVIEAVQFNGRNSADIHEFCGDNVLEPVGEEYLEIVTLEGNMRAIPGDYIIKGVKGEFYPCKPDIFAETYTQEPDMPAVAHTPVKLEHDLLTTKFTEVYHEPESEMKYNAPHHFVVQKADGIPGDERFIAAVNFQEGPIKECGVNGVCNEDLIAMVICRLEHFQKSPFACRDNAIAITKLEETLLWLRKRTIGRENRGVEGTNKV